MKFTEHTTLHSDEINDQMQILFHHPTSVILNHPIANLLFVFIVVPFITFITTCIVMTFPQSTSKRLLIIKSSIVATIALALIYVGTYYSDVVGKEMAYKDKVYHLNGSTTISDTNHHQGQNDDTLVPLTSQEKKEITDKNKQCYKFTKNGEEIIVMLPKKPKLQKGDEVNIHHFKHRPSITEINTKVLNIKKDDYTTRLILKGNRRPPKNALLDLSG